MFIKRVLNLKLIIISHFSIYILIYDWLADVDWLAIANWLMLIYCLPGVNWLADVNCLSVSNLLDCVRWA